jgi:adenylate cyclase
MFAVPPRTLRTALWLTLGWSVSILVTHWIVRRVPTSLPRELIMAVTGATMGILSAWFELSVIPRYNRTLTVGGLLVVRTLFYVVMLTVVINTLMALLLGVFERGGLFNYYRSDTYRSFMRDGRFPLTIVALTLLSFVINFVRQVDRMLGPGMLVNLLLGRYHQPVSEDRIFMFVDLNDSTTIAERLGPARFNEFKNDFFYDITEAILQTRGRIYQYVGDEVVVTWTVQQGLRQGNCLRCFFLMTEAVHERKDQYLTQYGVVPEFKAGLHGGPVITAEIGDIKKDIVHSGDTVNTAARIEAQCRPLDRRVLVSEALLQQCRVPSELQIEDMGDQPLRGKARAVRLYSLRPQITGQSR